MNLKKSLGQNFFNNPNLAQKIIERVVAETPESVIEIGPGDGFFTKYLLDKGVDLTLIEKDDTVYQFLLQKFPGMKILNADFLELNFSQLEIKDKTVVFGSLPYNVSKVIIRRCLEELPQVESFYFIIQKEVAQKYAKSDRKSSLISTMTEIYADCRIFFDISPASFIPQPKVTSTFVKFSRNKNIERIKNLTLFEKLVKLAYAKPRKMLRNNLKEMSLDLGEFSLRRAADLSFEEFVNLAGKAK